MDWQNVCIFGDSITWGAHRLPSRLSWANLLRTYLENNNLKYRVYDLGIDMNTTKDLLERFPVEASARKPDIVIFNIGVNDSLYRKSPDNPETNISDFENNIRQLIEMALAHTKKIIMVGLVKGDDRLTNPLAQSTTGKIYTKERVRIYDEKLKTITTDYNFIFADVYNKLGDTYFSDGLHPNENGYKKMFEVIKEAFEKLENGIVVE